MSSATLRPSAQCINIGLMRNTERSSTNALLWKIVDGQLFSHIFLFEIYVVVNDPGVLSSFCLFLHFLFVLEIILNLQKQISMAVSLYSPDLDQVKLRFTFELM